MFHDKRAAIIGGNDVDYLCQELLNTPSIHSSVYKSVIIRLGNAISNAIEPETFIAIYKSIFERNNGEDAKVFYIETLDLFMSIYYSRFDMLEDDFPSYEFSLLLPKCREMIWDGNPKKYAILLLSLLEDIDEYHAGDPIDIEYDEAAAYAADLSIAKSVHDHVKNVYTSRINKEKLPFGTKNNREIAKSFAAAFCKIEGNIDSVTDAALDYLTMMDLYAQGLTVDVSDRIIEIIRSSIHTSFKNNKLNFFKELLHEEEMSIFRTEIRCIVNNYLSNSIDLEIAKNEIIKVALTLTDENVDLVKLKMFILSCFEILEKECSFAGQIGCAEKIHQLSDAISDNELHMDEIDRIDRSERYVRMIVEDFEGLDAPIMDVTDALEASNFQRSGSDIRHMDFRESYKIAKDNAAKLKAQCDAALKSLNAWLNGQKDSDGKTMDQIVIEGKRYTFFGIVKRLLIGVAMFQTNFIIALMVIIVRWVLKSKAKKNAKRKMTLLLEEEIEILNEKIDDARGDGNRKAKYQLMRSKKAMENALKRIKYNIGAEVSSKEIEQLITRDSKKGNGQGKYHGGSGRL